MADIAEAGVRIGLEVTGEREAERAIDNLRKAQQKQSRTITQAVLKANQLAKKSAAIIAKGSNAEIRAKQESINANKEIARALQDRIVKLGRVEKALESLKLKEGMLTGKEKKAAREGVERLNAQIRKREEQIKATRRGLLGEKEAAMGAAVFEAKRQRAKDKVKESKEGMAKFASYSGIKAGKDIGEGFKEAIGAISARDMKGMATGLAKSLGSGIMGIGAKMKRYSLDKAEKGESGKMAKAMGAVGGAIGGIAGLLAKIGPILSMVGGLIMAVVKLFMDAESAAKDFNREILATAGSADQLYEAGGDSTKAWTKLDNTVTQIRKSAIDLQKNMDWGISKKEHAEFLGALTSEGVSIKQIEKDAEAANMAVGDYSAEIVHLGVAYSRMFGVSLQEIGTLQAEMTREMGMGLETVTQSFNMMARGAAESGIASNKFFAIIRGVSADMSLFNLRMEDAVLTLKMLGKAMSPKNAEKFLQTITSFYKGQGLQERVGATIKAGGAKKVGAMMQQDVTARIEGMSNDVASKIGDPAAAAELKTAVAAGPAATSKFMAKHLDKLDGSTQDAIMQAAITQGKLTKGGLVDVASTLKDASPRATMKMWEMTSQNMFGKPIAELTDVERLAFEKVSGVSDEMQDQAIKAEMGLKTMKEGLAYQIETGGKLSPEQAAMAKAMNLQGSKEQQAAAVRGKTDEEIWGTMTELQKKQAMGTDDVKDYAKQQGQALDTIANKLERIFDALMEFVYGELGFIGDLFIKLLRFFKLGPSDESMAERRIRKEASKSKDPTVAKALAATKGDALKFGSELMKSQEWQENVVGLLSAKTEKGSKQEGIQKDFLFKALQKGVSGPELGKAIAKRGYSGMLEKAGLGKEMTVAKSVGDLSAGKTHQEFKLGAGVGPSDIMKALEEGGVSMDEAGQIVQEMFGSMGQVKLANVAGDVMTDVTKAVDDFNAAAQEAPAQAGPVADTPEAKVQALQDQMTALQGGVPEDAAMGQSIAPAVEDTAENTEAMQASMERGATANEALLNEGTSGTTLYFKFPLNWLNNQYAKAVQGAVEEGVLPSIRKALFEYFMYSGMNPEDLAKGLQEGTIDPATFGQDFADAVQEKGYEEGSKSFLSATPTAGEQAAAAATAAAPNAAGGVVTGVAGGMAVVKRPAAGEGLASIGKGETIGPAGGRGGGAQTIRLELSQDLKKVIQAEAGNVVYLDKARSRYQG